MSERDKFLANVSTEPNTGCWLWLGAVDNNGYARMNRGRATVRAHRVSWELANGPVPRGEGYHGTCVLHRCDNGNIGCVNPDHLFLGTQRGNIADRHAKGRTSRGTKHAASCVGRPTENLKRGEANGNAKLTRSIVDHIRILASTGVVTNVAIARAFGLSKTHVGKIIKREWWR